MIIIEPSKFVTTQWAGGSTTQLWIWPPQSQVAARDFEIRVSMATVEQSGAFSDFSGYRRALLLLGGEGLLIEHINNDSLASSFLYTSSSPCWYFFGSDKVNAVLKDGPVQDFNVITRENAALKMERFIITPHGFWHDGSQPKSGMQDIKNKVYGVYLYQGALNVQGAALKAGQLLLSLSPIDDLTGDALGAEGVYFSSELVYPIEI